MKKSQLLGAVCACVITFTSLAASAAPIPVDMTTGVWTITAFDTGGNDWSGSTLTIETQTAATDDWLLSGYFFWDNGAGAFGRENFTGTLFLDRSLELSGFELVSATSGIIIGDYFADLALSNNDIVDGTWVADGAFLPTDGWTATRPVPVPAAAWLFGSGLLGLVGMARRKKS